jgi:hypothetical protein
MPVRVQTIQKWRKIVLGQKSSGMLPMEFCREHNICPQSFYTWRKQLGMDHEPEETDLSLAHDTESRGLQSIPKRFMRLMPPTTEQETFYIETPNGYKISAGYIKENSLKQVLEILRAL